VDSEKKFLGIHEQDGNIKEIRIILFFHDTTVIKIVASLIART